MSKKVFQVFQVFNHSISSIGIATNIEMPIAMLIEKNTGKRALDLGVLQIGLSSNGTHPNHNKKFQATVYYYVTLHKTCQLILID